MIPNAKLCLGGLVVVLWLAVPAMGQAPAASRSDPSPTVEPSAILDVESYRQALRSLATALRNENWHGARVAAESLRGRQFVSQGFVLAVDASLLAAVAEVNDTADARPVLERLHALQQALDAPSPESVGGVDEDLLQRIDEEQRVEALRAEGKLASVDVPSTAFRNPFTRWLGGVLTSLWERVEDWLRWLLDHWRGQAERETSTARLDARLVTLFVVLLVAVMAWLALRWLRAGPGRRETSSMTSGELTRQPGGDDNPLSREGDEWQRYADQLAAAGRLREAIRAWYHAVLVHLYRNGLLHYRQGRTNWEYIAALPPRLAWRTRFIDLTRRFEHEWYGHGASGEDALEACRRAAHEILAQVGSGVTE